MKRLASAILLSIFLYNIIGYYFSFSVLNWQNNVKMSAYINKSKSLETLRIHKTQLKNVIFKNDKKEISYHGEMYDIKDMHIEGDYTVFSCLKDHKEKKLLANLTDHIYNNIDVKSSANNKHSNKTAQKNILKDYFLNIEIVSFFNPTRDAFFKSPSPLIGSLPTLLSAPPPKQA